MIIYLIMELSESERGIRENYHTFFADMMDHLFELLLSGYVKLRIVVLKNC